MSRNRKARNSPADPLRFAPGKAQPVVRSKAIEPVKQPAAGHGLFVAQTFSDENNFSFHRKSEKGPRIKNNPKLPPSPIANIDTVFGNAHQLAEVLNGE